MTSSTHVLIVNQHGDNRGDEAALKAMLAAFAERLVEVRFSLVHQFQDPNLPIDYRPHQVNAMSMRMPAFDYLRLGIYTAFRTIGLDLRWLLTQQAQSILEAYDSADLVVSAPGGPYFGDLYRGHELAHWLYVYLGRLNRIPTFLYATSVGPFATPGLNTLRRRFFGWFDDLCVREERSAAHLHRLRGVEVEVTADSALQRSVPPFERSEYFKDTERAKKYAEKYLVVLTALEHRFPEDDDGPERQRRYEEAFLAAVAHLMERRDCHFLILPQIYGAARSDVPYLTALAERFPAAASWEIVDPTLDSDAHRAIVGMCDLSIACRYHPQIFAAGGATPGVCVYYEHKAHSFMESLGLGHLAFDIRTVEAAPLCAALDQAMAEHEAIAAQIQKAMVGVRRRASRTTEKACALLHS